MPRRESLSSKTFIRPRRPPGQGPGQGQMGPGRPGGGGGGGGSGPGDTSIPILTDAPPPLRQPTRVARAKTLTRPERSQPQAPLINPTGRPVESPVGARNADGGFNPWRVYSRVITFWAPGFVLATCGLRDGASQQAWREKIALVSLAALVSGFVGFITMGLNKVFCPSTEAVTSSEYTNVGDVMARGQLGVNGWMTSISSARLPGTEQIGVDLYSLSSRVPGYDITTLYQRDFPACAALNHPFATLNPCNVTLTSGLRSGCPLGRLDQSTYQQRGFFNTSKRVGFGWEDVSQKNFTNFLVGVGA